MPVTERNASNIKKASNDRNANSPQTQPEQRYSRDPPAGRLAKGVRFGDSEKVGNSSSCVNNIGNTSNNRHTSNKREKGTTNRNDKVATTKTIIVK